jgi:hypothetical protein
MALTGVEGFYSALRRELTSYMASPAAKQRVNDQAGEGYLDKSQMDQDGVWATTTELYFMAMMLSVDIFIYRDGTWQRFSQTGTLRQLQSMSPAIFLKNTNNNHYDYVLSII